MFGKKKDNKASSAAPGPFGKRSLFASELNIKPAAVDFGFGAPPPETPQDNAEGFAYSPQAVEMPAGSNADFTFDPFVVTPTPPDHQSQDAQSAFSAFEAFPSAVGSAAETLSSDFSPALPDTEDYRPEDTWAIPSVSQTDPVLDPGDSNLPPVQHPVVDSWEFTGPAFEAPSHVDKSQPSGWPLEASSPDLAVTSSPWAEQSQALYPTAGAAAVFDEANRSVPPDVSFDEDYQSARAGFDSDVMPSLARSNDAQFAQETPLDAWTPVQPEFVAPETVAAPGVTPTYSNPEKDVLNAHPTETPEDDLLLSFGQQDVISVGDMSTTAPVAFNVDNGSPIMQELADWSVEHDPPDWPVENPLKQPIESYGGDAHNVVDPSPWSGPTFERSVSSFNPADIPVDITESSDAQVTEPLSFELPTDQKPADLFGNPVDVQSPSPGDRPALSPPSTPKDVLGTGPSLVTPFDLDAIPPAPADSQFWQHWEETRQVPVGQEASSQFLDTVNETLYPADYFSEDAFEEAAQLLFPETADTAPSDFGFEDPALYESVVPDVAFNTDISRMDAYLAPPQAPLHSLESESVPETAIQPTPPSQQGEPLASDFQQMQADMDASARRATEPAQVTGTDVGEWAPSTEPSGNGSESPNPQVELLSTLMESLTGRPDDDSGFVTPLWSQEELLKEDETTWTFSESDEDVSQHTDLAGLGGLVSADEAGEADLTTWVLPESAADASSPVPVERAFDAQPNIQQRSSNLDLSTDSLSDFNFDDDYESESVWAGPGEYRPGTSDASPALPQSASQMQQAASDSRNADFATVRTTASGSDELQVLSHQILSERHKLLLVQHQNQWVLMGQCGPESEAQVSVIKIFTENPLRQNPVFQAIKEGLAGEQDMYVVQVGSWQGVIGAGPDQLVLHTELT